MLEVYPALVSPNYPRADRTPDQHDAYSVAAWLSESDRNGSLLSFLKPQLSPADQTVAEVEGWILGVGQSSEMARTAPMPKLVVGGIKRVPTRAKRRTTEPGFRNGNNQIVIRRTDERGNDHNQNVYVLCCGSCSHEYGANGSDIWQRRCPSCHQGAKGLLF